MTVEGLFSYPGVTCFIALNQPMPCRSLLNRQVNITMDVGRNCASDKERFMTGLTSPIVERQPARDDLYTTLNRDIHATLTKAL